MKEPDSFSVLLVDDEPKILHSYQSMLSFEGINNVMCCIDSRNVIDILARQSIGVVVLDLSMPHLSGEALLPMIVENYPDMPVIIVTATNEIKTAVKCIQAGAYDYLVKPVETAYMLSVIQRAVEYKKSISGHLQDTTIQYGPKNPNAFSRIISANKKMLSCFKYVENIAPTAQPVLITGETGVGKELIAHAIHLQSKRSGNFIAVNIAGLDDTVFSDTLFGHTKGAFTGAHEKRAGLIEKAAGGTLFMDEIGDLSNASQVKLLRLLQEHEYFPVGSDDIKTTDARFVFSTRQDLKELKDSHKYRDDLYYRLSAHNLHIPPLRERLDDLPLLIDYFLDKASRETNRAKPVFPNTLLPLLSNYSFPGNIRELQSIIYEAVINAKSKMLSVEFFLSTFEDQKISPKNFSNTNDDTFFSSSPTLLSLKELSQHLISEAMKRSNNNQAVAAKMLGISRQALNKRLKRS